MRTPENRMKTMRPGAWAAALAVFLWAATAMAQDPLGLKDLLRLGLERSREIKISTQELKVANLTREKAFSVMIPQLSAYTTHTRYDEESATFPKWESGWGMSAGQSFTLNGKELIALRMAEQTISQKTQDLASVKESYVYQVARQYFDVLMAQRSQDIAQAEVQRLKAHLEAVRIRLKLEDVDKTARFRTEAELSQAAADLTQAQNSLLTAREVLARNLDLAPGFAVSDPLDHEPDPPVLPDEDMEALIQAGLSNRADLKSGQLAAGISKDNIKIAKSAYWPSVSVEASYMGMDRDPTYDGYDHDAFSLGLTFSIPLYQGGFRKADVAEAMARSRQTDLANDELKRQIAVDVARAFYQARSQARIIAALNDRLVSARENYDAVAKRFAYGLADSLDVIDANTLLKTAEQQAYSARYGLRLALINLKRAQGLFLEEIEPPKGS